MVLSRQDQCKPARHQDSPRDGLEGLVGVDVEAGVVVLGFVGDAAEKVLFADLAGFEGEVPGSIFDGFADQ